MKKRLSIFMIICLLTISFCVPAYASNNPVQPSEGFWKDTTYFPMQWVKALGESGVLMRTPDYSQISEWENDWKTTNNIQDAPSNPTRSELVEYLNQGTLIEGDQVEFTGNTWNFMLYSMNRAIEESKYLIGYSYDFTQYYNNYRPDLNVPQTLAQYNGTRLRMPSNGGVYIGLSARGQRNYYIGIRDAANPNTATLYNAHNNTNVVTMYSTNINNFPNETAQTWTGQKFVYSSVSGNKFLNNQTLGSNPAFGSFNGYQDSMYIYYSANNLPSNPNIPNYYTTDSYNTTKTENSHNTTTENIDNSVTYQDVYNYVTTNYNYGGGAYPSPVEVNNYINNYIPESPSGGGGSGSGGSGSGGSGGSGDGETGIFDFLSNIGAVLGNLIKNLGNVLSELVEGIASTITALFESIPTVFGDFLGALLGWLPTELRALITLSISAMVIVGLIKLFRG